jgi:hypothetical protein
MGFFNPIRNYITLYGRKSTYTVYLGVLGRFRKRA